jgi:hypothetical protein
MLYLWIFGDNIEEAFGRLGYIARYLTGGVVAGLAQVAIDPNSQVPTIGASGAVATILGAYLVLYPPARVRTLLLIVYFNRLGPARQSGVGACSSCRSLALSSRPTRRRRRGLFWPHRGFVLACWWHCWPRSTYNGPLRGVARMIAARRTSACAGQSPAGASHPGIAAAASAFWSGSMPRAAARDAVPVPPGPCAAHLPHGGLALLLARRVPS